MASTVSKPGRKLAEILQEKQEPFVLEAHLLEKRHLKNSLNSETGSGNCPGDNSANCSCCVSKEKRDLKPSNLLKAVYNRFVLINVNQKGKRLDTGKRRIGAEHGISKIIHEVAKSDGFFSSSSFSNENAVSSCSRSVIEELWEDYLFATDTSQTFNPITREKREADQGKQVPRGFTGDCKQLSPVSVLEEPSSHNGPPHAEQKFKSKKERHSSTCRVSLAGDVKEDFILPGSLWGLHSQSTNKKVSDIIFEGLQGPPQSHDPLEILKSKRVLQETKQLLFDCVREVMEAHRRKKREPQSQRQFLSYEEIGKLICEKMTACGGRCVDQINSSWLADSILPDLIVKWDDFEKEKNDIACDIGDGILEGIRDEIVIDMIKSCFS